MWPLCPCKSSGYHQFDRPGCPFLSWVEGLLVQHNKSHLATTAHMLSGVYILRDTDRYKVRSDISAQVLVAGAGEDAQM